MSLSLRNKRVLVTGGAGFVGSHLVDSLLEREANVTIIDDLSTGKISNLSKFSEVEFIEASILDDATISEHIKSFDCIYHLACLGVRHSIRYPMENHRVNADGTLRLLIAARDNGIKQFIYCSSSEVYGSAIKDRMAEDHTCNPLTVYGASKLAGERYTMAFGATYGMNVTVVRPFNMFGPRSHHEGLSGELIPKTIVRALNSQDLLIFGDGSFSRDFSFVKDIVEGIVEISLNNQCAGKTINLCSGKERKIVDVVSTIKSLIPESKSVIRYCDERPGDVSRHIGDCSQSRALINWSPKVSFDIGLAQTVEYFKVRSKTEDLLQNEIPLNW